MRYTLAAMARKAGQRRKIVTLRPIVPTKAQANDLARINTAILAPWLDSRQRIIEAYQRELARILTTDSIDDLADLFAAIADEVERLTLELTPSLRNWALRMEAWHRRKWGQTVLAGAGVDVRYLIGPADAQETIQAFMARNTALVKDVSAQVQGRISDAVYRGLQGRVPAREVGKQIAEATGLARKRAVRIAADQSVKLAAALDAQRQREAGLAVFKWRHSGKLHARPWHKSRDGKLFEIDSRREVEFVGGKKVYGDETIPADDNIGGPPFCACTSQAVLILDGEAL